MPDRLLCLDPSSTAVGYAVFSPAGRLVSAGSVRASSPDFLRRMHALADKLAPVVDGARPCRVACEVHGGMPMARGAKVKRNRMTGVTLSHGQGYLLCWLTREKGLSVERVTDRQWTGGRESKETRAARVRAAFPRFAAVWAADKGGDALDAAGLGMYVLVRGKS